MPIVGSGEFRYELVPSWPSMPKYWSFETASDMAVNSRDEVHVFSRGLHPLTVWETDGTFITSWGEGQFKMPHGIYIGPDDTVWLVDPHLHTVTQHEPDGEVIRTLGKRGVPTPSFQGTPFNMPSGVAIAPNSDIFVSDGYGGHRVHRFSRESKLLLSWGREGTGPGEFVNLHNIGVDSRSRVFICDRENHRIQLFDADGNFLEQWTDLRSPNDLSILRDTIYVCEGGGVSIWTLDGDLITRFRGNQGPLSGITISGHGITVDSQGSIYLGHGKVTKLQRI